MKVDPHKNFGTRECPSCACDVEANHNRCPICSYEFPAAPSTVHRNKMWIAAILLALILISLFRSLLR